MLAPALCPACRSHLARNLLPCSRCAVGLSEVEYKTLGLCHDCRRRPPDYRVFAPYLYRPPLSGLLLEFKYRNKFHYGRLLGHLLGTALQKQLQQLPDVLVPVPMATTRRMWRGYSHAEIIAREVGKLLGVEVASDWLACTRNPKPQAELRVAERKRNLSGVFRLKAQPSGRRVAIVDDVVTSSSTAAELSRLLLAADVAEVEIFALMRAV